MARRTAVARLKDRVTIQTATDTPDAAQQPEQTWADGETVWAEVVPVGGAEFVAGEQVTATATYRVRVRKSAATDAAGAKERLKVITQGGRILNLISALPDDNDRRFLLWFCSERAA